MFVSWAFAQVGGFMAVGEMQDLLKIIAAEAIFRRKILTIQFFCQ